MPIKRRVYDFKVTLLDTKPAIWRRIQVPEKYTFWDLHVAIQDSMGWLDYHLHAFRFGKGRPRWEIGIPDDDGFDDIKTLPGWEMPITEYFDVGAECLYEYDFGDSWVHALTLEGILLAKKRQRYPVCVAGEMACPPEDCGGVGGYHRLIEILSDPADEEYDEIMTWLGGPYDPKAFEPAKVKFDNPRKRWDAAFSAGKF